MVMQFDTCALPHELHFKPSEFYFRRALRRAKKKADAVKIGLFLVREVEILTKHILDAGLSLPAAHLSQYRVPRACDHVQL